MKEITLRPIGVIRSPHQQPTGTPIQSAYAEGIQGEVILDEPYVAALADLERVERIWLLYFFDRARAWRPRVVPFLDDQERGLFSTRAPARPNPIGLSVVRLMSVSGNTLKVNGIDVLDGTPLLDIKPYVPAFDAHPDSRAGWLDSSLPSGRELADTRFSGAESPHGGRR